MAPKLIKPRLLFISPVFPSPDGPGLAIRPYYQIVSLSRIYSIHLLVAGTIPERPVDEGDIKNYCENIDYICRYRFSGWKFSLWHRSCRLMDKLRHFVRGDDLSFVADMADIGYLQHNKTLAKIASMKFDMVHVFRLYLAPVAEILKKHGLNSFYFLDMDDIESETRNSISKLYFRNKDFIRASRLNNESTIFFDMETKSLPAYDQTFTCSHRDRNILQNRFPGKVISVLPNVVPIPKKTRNHRANQIFTILFVGTLEYYPNTDALLFFADQIAPILREKSRQPWILRVVGTFPENKRIKHLESFPEIKFAGRVKDLSPEYDAADIVVAPIRGGGGTRIKILEAFAHGVPVVSTSKGCEGLNVENRVHLIIEDDARLFAEACIQLMTDNRFADKISRQALDLVVLKYSPEIINQAWTSQLPHTGLN